MINNVNNIKITVYVYSDIIMAIPEGRKSFAWFTTHNDKNVCLIMELAENKQISNIKIVNACFNSELAIFSLIQQILCN